MPEATYLAVRGQFWFLMLLSHEKILIMPFTYMQALREVFQQYGPVTNIYHPPRKEGTGYVTMASPAHATVRMPGLHSVAATLVLPVSCVHAGCMTHCVLPAWHGRMCCLCDPSQVLCSLQIVCTHRHPEPAVEASCTPTGWCSVLWPMQAALKLDGFFFLGKQLSVVMATQQSGHRKGN